MATVSFRVPDDMRKRMDEAGVDWPARFREFVEEELRRQQMERALAKCDAFREKYAGRTKGVSMSAEVIRSRYEDH